MTEKNRFPHATAFRLDDPTHVQLTTAAAAAGVSPGVWVRQLVLKALGSQMKAPRVRRAAANVVELNAILDELRPLGRNLNQLARHANVTGSAATIACDIADMRVAVEAAMVRVLDALRIDDDA
jgi:hypothetical protein